jgi:adenylate kinase
MSRSIMRVILVGPPGAGKGTQSQYVAAHFGIPNVSTGEIFRANVSSGTDLGRLAKKFMDQGDLVPDEVTVEMVRDRLAQPDVVNGFLLDGFPRNVDQASELDRILDTFGWELSAAVEFKLEHHEVIRRLSGRRTCRRCSRVWHLEYDPTTREDVCDHCGGELYQRGDDSPATIRHRLEVYTVSTAPLIQFYESQRKLVAIDALGPVEDVAAYVVATLGQFVG